MWGRVWPAAPSAAFLRLDHEVVKGWWSTSAQPAQLTPDMLPEATHWHWGCVQRECELCMKHLQTKNLKSGAWKADL